MRFTLAAVLVFSAIPLRAEVSAEQGHVIACLGWGLDRTNLENVNLKLQDLRLVLMDQKQPTERRVMALEAAASIGKLIEAVEGANLASGKLYASACPGSPE
ncbi:hypothetical protein [Pseudophaeobacter sp. C1-32P7]|uniref:hypothetical protein n=1 Tax=Pseudophaeobacter sp. C1-32P7 TaxID=3098142 RepID=UPI0034D6A7C9